MLQPVYRNYQDEIRRLDLTATWLPGDPLMLGEVGTLRNGRFFRETTLSQLGIACRSEVGEPILFTRSNATQRSADGGSKAGVPSVATGEMSFEFSKKGQFALSASNLRRHRISNIGHVCDSIVRYGQLGKWQSAWVLVDQVWTADYLQVLISQSAKASIRLSVSVDRIPGLEVLSVASLTIATVSQSGDILNVRGPNLTPFFSGRKLRHRLFADNDTKPISTGGSPDETIDVEPLHFMDDLMASWSVTESTGES
jgi:hypothetical protein